MILSLNRVALAAAMASVSVCGGSIVFASTVNNGTVTATGYSSFVGYPPSSAIDNAPNTDYASTGGGNSTFLDFNFGAPLSFNTITQTDRVTSGGANGTYVGGVTEFNTQYDLIFANNPSFTSPVGTVHVTRAAPPPPPTMDAPAGNNASQFTTISSIPNYTAQYVRWQVTNGAGNNGAANFVFNGAPAFEGTNASAGGAAPIRIGKTFDIAPGSQGITADQIGVFDYAGNGLVASHNVTLYQLDAAGSAATTKTPIETVTVPAGTGATLANGYRYVPLTSSVFMAPGTHWAVVAYGLDNLGNGGDPYGDGGSGPLNPQGSTIITSTGFDPYDFGLPLGAETSGYPTAGDTGVHSAASILYEYTVPEPTSLAFIGLAGAGIFFRRTLRERPETK